MKKLLVALLLLICALPSLAQNSTTVSGNVTDLGGQPWFAGNVTFTFVSVLGKPGPYTWNGGFFNQNLPIVASINGAGNYSISIPSNQAMTPAGSTWLLTVNSGTTSLVTASTTVTVAGATQTINFTPPIPFITGVSNTVAYSDSSVSANTGQFYFSLTLANLRVCLTGANGICTSWGSAGGGGGGAISGLTPGQIPIAGSATSLISSVPAPSGLIVGTTDTQTLTNKSIDSSEVNSGTLSCSRLPAFTGDTTTPGNSCVTSTVRLNGLSIPASTPITGTNGGSQLVAASGHSVSIVLACPALSGSSSAYTCSTVPTFTPQAGDGIFLKVDVANVGVATLNVNATSAVPVKKQGGGTSLATNDFLAGQYTLLEFDGANWQMQGQTGNASGGGISGSGTTNQTAYFSSTSNVAGVGPGLTGQVLVATNAGPPSYKSSGVGGTDVNSATYTVQCDSGTTLIDRATTLRFITTTPTVTIPDPTASGCGSNFPVTLIASGVTVTVNRTSTAVFNIYSGNTPVTSATTFTLTSGQYATLTSPDNANWLVREVSGGGTPCTINALSLQYNNGGVFGCLNNFTYTSATGVLTANQLANSNDTIYGKRFTDTSPTGTWFHFQNAAANADIYNADVNGNFKASTSVQTGTAPAITAGTGGLWGAGEGTDGTGLASVDFIDANSTQHVLVVNNNNTGAMPISRVVCINITPVTVSANVTSDQNLMSCTLAANTLNVVGRTLKIWVSGVYTTPAASVATINLKAKLCTVSGCGSGTVINLATITSSANPGTVTNNAYNLTLYLTTQTAGASSVYEAHGLMGIDLGAANTSADSFFNDTNTAVTSAIDSTVQLFLQISTAFSVASGSNISTERQLIVEVIN